MEKYFNGTGQYCITIEYYVEPKALKNHTGVKKFIIIVQKLSKGK